MQSSRKAIGIFLALLIVGAVFMPSVPTNAAPESGVNRIIIELEDIDALPDSIEDPGDQVREIRRISDRAPRSYATAQGAVRARDMRRWRVFEVENNEVETYLKLFNENPVVVSARVEEIYYEARIANDPRSTLQYALRDSAQFGISAERAWDETTGSSNTIIAVIDGGVDLSHEDLDGKIWTNGGEIPGNGIDDDGNGYVDDIHGWDFVADQPGGIAIDHATHVAGLAAAESNNGVGVSGVDWGARIMSIRALSQFGAGREDDIVAAINYAVAGGADIINMSIVGRESEALLAAIENAYAAGVVVVAAAGNNGFDTGKANVYPACAETNGVNMVLGVGATDEDGEPTRFSNYGDCVDISAPGDDILSTAVGNRYREMTGTSMSAPIAAGVAGLYLAKNPGASPSSVIAALSHGDSFTGEDIEETIEWNELYKGRLNAAIALGVSGPASPSSPTATPTPTPQPARSGSSDGGGSDGGGGGGGGGGGDGDCCAHDDNSSTPEASAAKPARVAGIKTVVKANLSLIPKINAAFRSVFTRNPNIVEHGYWLGRVKRGEKQTFAALVGAMAYQNAQGRTYDPSSPKASRSKAQVAGTISSSSLVSKINSIHRQAYGRNPTVSEHAYWVSRVTTGDKNSELALLGAMIFHHLTGISH